MTWKLTHDSDGEWSTTMMENDPRQWWRMVDDNDETAGVLHDDTAGVLHDDNQLTKTKLKGTKVLR